MLKVKRLALASTFLCAFSTVSMAQVVSGGGGGTASSVAVTSLPALPTGTNAIGTVTVNAPLPAGTNAIGSVVVTSLPALPTGANAIGTVSVTALPTLPAGTNTIGRTALPTGTGAAASGAATITTANTYQTLFGAGTITNGCYIQNPSSSVTLYVDFSGATGTTLASTSEAVLPGGSAACAFVPTNAITVYANTASSAIIAGRF